MSKGPIEWAIGMSLLLCSFITNGRTGFDLSNSANCFSLDFYKILASSTSGNMISSPFSVDTVMSILLAGAGSNTAKELQAALQYGSTSISDMENAFKSDIGQLNQGDGKNTSTIVNSLWIQKGFSVKPSFQQIVTGDFYAEEQNMDFSGNAVGATDTINSWVNSQTHGLIPKIFDQPLDPSTILALVNAIYFKGVWKYKFDPTNTNPGTFHTEDSSNPSVPLMNQQANFNYNQDNVLKAEILEMNYVGDQISMQLILPSSGTKMADFEAS